MFLWLNIFLLRTSEWLNLLMRIWFMGSSTLQHLGTLEVKQFHTTIRYIKAIELNTEWKPENTNILCTTHIDTQEKAFSCVILLISAPKISRGWKAVGNKFINKRQTPGMHYFFFTWYLREKEKWYGRQSLREIFLWKKYHQEMLQN